MLRLLVLREDDWGPSAIDQDRDCNRQQDGEENCMWKLSSWYSQQDFPFSQEHLFKGLHLLTDPGHKKKKKKK